MIIAGDPRVTEVASAADRARLFSEWCAEKCARDEQRKADEEAKKREAFKEMMEEMEKAGQIKVFTTWEKFLMLCSSDMRYSMIENEKEKKALFKDYQSGMKVRLEQERTNKNALATEEFHRLIRSDPNIICTTKWEYAKEKYVTPGNIKNLDPLAALRDYEKYMDELEAKEVERCKVERVKKYRKDRKARDAFKELLDGCCSSHEINITTSWDSFSKKYQDDPRLIAMEADDYSGTSAKEFFDNCTARIQREYFEQKKQMAAIVQHQSDTFQVTETTRFDEFEAIIPDQIKAEIPRVNMEFFFRDMVQSIGAKHDENKQGTEKRRIKKQL